MDEVQAQASAEAVLGLADGDVLKDLPSRRRIVRFGDTVVKAFSRKELDAFERERAGLRALASTGLAPPLIGDGERWTATRWIDGDPFNDVAGTRHGELGTWLARLHAVPPAALPDWPLGPRLLRHFDDPPEACPAELVAPLADVARSWIPHLRQDTFVHGDWGDSNVLAEAESGDIVAIIDLEDCHIGDAAEDFRWQAMLGTASQQLGPMWAAYGDLGPHAGERIAAATTELILDVLGWGLAEAELRRTLANCLPTLRALIDGWLPA